MKNIELNTIEQEHLTGHWMVEGRSIFSGNVDMFTDIRIIEMQKDYYRSVNGKVIDGTFKVMRENEIIYNPQIKFYVNNNEVGNAIITRLFLEDKQGITKHNLTLYFTTGLELKLSKHES